MQFFVFLVFAPAEVIVELLQKEEEPPCLESDVDEDEDEDDSGAEEEASMK